MSINIQQEINSINTDWRSVIKNYNGLESIQNFLHSEAETFGEFFTTYPKSEDIFRCFKYFDPQETKVVILGQDPYHSQPNQAMGLCFGVGDGITPPPSLKNINKELKTDVNKEIRDYSLEYWAQQGVLLLNSALTVRSNNPSSHMRVWKQFSQYIIDYLNEKYPGIVYIAWGAFAHGQLENVGKNQRNHMIVSSHPSPLSAYKPLVTYPSFMGSKPFSKVNTYLRENNYKEIEW